MGADQADGLDRQAQPAPVSAAYPILDGRVQAPRLEIGVAEHCNLSCRACSHLSPLIHKHLEDPNRLEVQLAILARHYHVEHVRLLGGEPLLHPDLLGIVDAVRSSGVCDKVCVVTNGVRLPRMPDAFWEAVDRVEVSLYPGNAISPDEQRACLERAQATGTVLKLNRYDDFREAYSEPGTGDERLIADIFETCLIAHRWRCHTLAGGRLYRCPQSYYLTYLIPGLAAGREHESVAIDESAGLGERIRALLASSVPPMACGHCLGTVGRRFPHVQVHRSEFRARQQHPAEALIDRALLDAAPRFVARASA